jgi:site-specific DNA-methyltransferase (adenine-specific)
MTPYYQDEACTIYHGDCRDVLPSLEPGSVSLTLTDPPYGVGIKYASYADELAATTKMVGEFVTLAAKASQIVAFTVGKWETELELYRTFPPRWRMCWYKGAQSTASPIGFNDWEAVFIYGAKIHRNAHDYFHAQPERMGAFGHPCPKPLKFCTTLIHRLTKPGDLVCDPFMGSGTTLRAAKDLGRRAIGIEIEERYCEVAAKRLAQSVLQFEDVA